MSPCQMDQARQAAQAIKSPIAIGLNNTMANSTYFFDPNQSQMTNNPNSNESMLKMKSNPSDVSMSEIDDGEFCRIHRGEPVIAIDDADLDRYGCNKCVFERLL